MIAYKEFYSQITCFRVRLDVIVRMSFVLVKNLSRHQCLWSFLWRLTRCQANSWKKQNPYYRFIHHHWLSQLFRQADGNWLHRMNESVCCLVSNNSRTFYRTLILRIQYSTLIAYLVIGKTGALLFLGDFASAR